VLVAPLEQVYAEFGSGLRSARAVRELLTFARAQWLKPEPKYLLLVGDGSYDGRDGLGYGTPASFLPVAIERGAYSDFGSDNWLAVDEASGASKPWLAVGRIPTDEPAELEAYVEKILAYESGSSAPS